MDKMSVYKMKGQCEEFSRIYLEVGNVGDKGLHREGQNNSVIKGTSGGIEPGTSCDPLLCLPD